MNINLIRFNTDIGKTKPENIIHTENACPFCDVANLTGILDTDGDIIFLRNKARGERLIFSRRAAP